MSDASKKFSNMWLDNQPYSGTTTSTGMNPKFFDCTSQVNLEELLCSYWRQCKRPSSSSKDAIGNGCTPETNFHIIIFSGMMSELAISSNSQPSDDENFQSAAILRDYAGRSRPGSWISVGPGSEKDLAVGRKLGSQNITYYGHLHRIWLQSHRGNDDL